MVRHISLPVACIVTLAACSPAQLAATATKAALPPETVTKIEGICRTAEPLVRLAAAMPSSIPAIGSAKDIAQFVGAFCDPLLAAGRLPPTADVNSLPWLSDNLAGLRAVLGR